MAAQLSRDPLWRSGIRRMAMYKRPSSAPTIRLATPRFAMTSTWVPPSGRLSIAETTTGGTNPPMHSSFRYRDQSLHARSGPLRPTT